MMKLLDDVVDVGLERLTKPSEAILARRATADSTGSTARSGNNARRVLLAALSASAGQTPRPAKPHPAPARPTVRARRDLPAARAAPTRPARRQNGDSAAAAKKLPHLAVSLVAFLA